MPGLLSFSARVTVPGTVGKLKSSSIHKGIIAILM